VTSLTLEIEVVASPSGRVNVPLKTMVWPSRYVDASLVSDTSASLWRPSISPRFRKTDAIMSPKSKSAE